MQINRPLYLIEDGGRLALGLNGQGPKTLMRAMNNNSGAFPLKSVVPAIAPSQLGDPGFREAHGLQYNYVAGAMANPFYFQIGFTGVEIAKVAKTFGVLATLLGVFAGGMLVARGVAGWH